FRVDSQPLPPRAHSRHRRPPLAAQNLRQRGVLGIEQPGKRPQRELRVRLPPPVELRLQSVPEARPHESWWYPPPRPPRNEIAPKAEQRSAPAPTSGRPLQ